MFLIATLTAGKSALATSSRGDNTTFAAITRPAEAVEYISRTIAQSKKGRGSAGKSTAHAATNKAQVSCYPWRELNTGESYVSRHLHMHTVASTHAYSTLSDYIPRPNKRALNFLRSPIMARI